MSKCTCRSYNWEIGETPEVILDPNKYFPFQTPAKTVCVDACIAEQIETLWNAGIWTMACCCGHNKQPPDVVLSEHQQAKEAKRILSVIDDRNWKVKAWKLVNL